MGLIKSTYSRLERVKEKRKLIQENTFLLELRLPDISFSECKIDLCRHTRQPSTSEGPYHVVPWPPLQTTTPKWGTQDTQEFLLMSWDATTHDVCSRILVLDFQTPFK